MIRAASFFASFVVVALSGHVLDRTTGQPLSGVHVRAGRAESTTDRSGRFLLRGVPPGPATLTMESDDVPLQRLTITIGSRPMQRDVRACSTTLDYNCGGPVVPANAGSGA